MLALIVVSSFYVLLAATALVLAIQAYTPCVSNFEGGCSMAKGMLAMASLLPAALSACLAVGIKSGLTSSPRFKPYANTAGVALIGVPVAYVVYTLKAIFLG